MSLVDAFEILDAEVELENNSYNSQRMPAMILKCEYTLTKLISNKKCGQMPNVMAALTNTGGAVCSMPQSLADAHC